MSGMLPPATLFFVDAKPRILSALRRLLRPPGFRTPLAEGGLRGGDIINRLLKLKQAEQQHLTLYFHQEEK